jgi:hypothetical protein
MNKEAGISLGTNDRWKELGILILLGQWGDAPCTLEKTQFFSVWKREKGGRGIFWICYIPNVFPSSSHQAIVTHALRQKRSKWCEPIWATPVCFATSFGWRIGLKVPVWLNTMVLVPVFQQKMLRLANGTAKPNTCCWLARWFDWSRWVAISSLTPFAVWVSSFMGDDWSWEKKLNN